MAAILFVSFSFYLMENPRIDSYVIV